MDTQPHSNCCPKCQTPLPADAPQGLCPKCLLAAVATPTDAGQPAGRPAPPAIGEIAAAFPQLEIIEFIGQGGMGFVFKARQPKLDRLVALKILPQSLAADPTFAERFNREARLLARLNHPGIVTVHDFGVVGQAPHLPGEASESPENSTISTQTEPNQTGKMPVPLFYYLLMEFVDGVNLRQAMQAGRFTPEQALAIVPKICEALQFAHNEGILHRDIKPENILLDAKGRVKIADFGIAKLVERGSPSRSTSDTPNAPGFTENSEAGNAAAGQRPALHALTEAGKGLGTPNYMAPEQLENAGDVDHRADIYSLGVVFYEMLTGELPLGRFAPPSQKSAADPRVDEVVLRALEKEKARRPASADEVKTQVETIATTPSRSSGGESAPSELAPTKQDWMTWSPLQSPEVGEICSHLTKSERNLFSVLGLLTAIWIPGTCFGLLALIRSDLGVGKWIVAAVWTALFAVSIPMLQQLIRHFLCSTIWAKEQGYKAEHLRLFSFCRGKILTACVLFAMLLALIFVQHKAVTRYLGLGNWVRTNSVPQGHSHRAPAPNGGSATVAQPVLSFSPVVEKALPFEGEGGPGPRLFSFGTGKVFPLPQDIPGGGKDAIANWLLQNGADVVAELQTDGASRLFGGLTGCEFAPTEAKTWSDLPAESFSAIWLNSRQEKATPFFTTNSLPATFMFATQGGTRGLVQITGFTENPRGVNIRYKLVQSKQPNPPVATLTFGPVVKRELNDFTATNENVVLDLDSGIPGKITRAFSESDPEDFMQWAAAAGVDVAAVVEPGEPTPKDIAKRNGAIFAATGINLPAGRLRGLNTYDMTVVPVNLELWNTPQPDLVQSNLAAAKPLHWNYLSGPTNKLVASWAFKTREGTIGLLQITGFAENPRGVKIRYKLVEEHTPRTTP
jgi:serine/threonine protein kinase